MKPRIKLEYLPTEHRGLSDRYNICIVCKCEYDVMLSHDGGLAYCSYECMFKAEAAKKKKKTKK